MPIYSQKSCGLPERRKRLRLVALQFLIDFLAIECCYFLKAVLIQTLQVVVF